MIDRRLPRRLLLALALSCVSVTVQAQCISISAVDTPLTENFDTLTNTGTGSAVPVGWSFLESGTNANALYNSGTGSGNGGDTWSFGAAGSIERAFGGLLSGSLTPTIGACFTNNTGAAIKALDIAYVGEQWRLGTADRAVPDRLDFQFSLDATGLGAGSWVDADALDFSSPGSTGSTGTRDGNASANRSALNATIGSLSIANGATFWVRWNDFNASGADDGLAIDDYTLTARGDGSSTPTPALSISDVTAAEGDAGTTPFMFTLSLSAPAGAGGVAISYTTADGSASAGQDYTAVTAGNAVIAEGSTSVTISVDVIGDTVTEPAENFFVDVTSATGATLADARGVGTISNDDVTIIPIHAIQGSTDTSPLVGTSVSTRGIVTGRRSNGFFLQMPDAEADADPATSEGIFVFTGNALPDAAQTGNAVIVSGTVIEFLPDADTGQLNLTEITGPTVTLISTGNRLPAPVMLTPDFPSPTGPLDQLERVEAMRVSAASFTVVAATGGDTSEANATGSSNGQLNLVVTGTARPFREAGIQSPDPAPGGGSFPPIPRWDFNPELLFSDTDALGGPRHDLAVGATLSNYVGPLDYGFRRYSVHQDPAVTPTIVQGPAPSPARAPTADEFTFAVYNFERLFDTLDDPALRNDSGGEPILTPATFDLRLGKASLGIRDFLHTPDILGAVEVENLAALQALADRINADAAATGQPDPQYAAFLQEGNDVGGIDVGLLVKQAEVSAGVARVEVLGVTQLGKDETWTEPAGGSSLLNDRPPLVLDAVIHYADGRALPLTAVVVHQRSLNDAEENSATGKRVRAKRQRQAEYLANQLQLMQTADPDRNLVVGGDFNAFEFNDGLTDVMGTATGLPSPDAATAVIGDGTDLVDPDLLNLTFDEAPDQRYSFEFDGNAQSLDHVLINQALGAAVGAYAVDHARINADFPEIWRGDASTVARLADHDPVLTYFSLASADLSLSAAATTPVAAPGASAGFTARLSNAGRNAASQVGVGFAFDAELPDLVITAPSGWTCEAPVVADGDTTAACSTASVAQDAQASFTLTATAPVSEAGQAITMAVSVASQTFDPARDNNQASTVLQVNQVTVAGTDLVLSIEGPASAPRRAPSVKYVYRVRNAGKLEAAAPQLVVRGNTGAGTVTAPAGWQCRREADRSARGYTHVCSKTGALAAGAVAEFSLNASTRPMPANRKVQVDGVVSSTTPDIAPANNQATLATTLQ